MKRYVSSDLFLQDFINENQSKTSSGCPHRNNSISAIAAFLVVAVFVAQFAAPISMAGTLPANVQNTQVLSNLELPGGFAYSSEELITLVRLGLDDGQASATDYSGNGNSGTINGALYVLDSGDGSSQSLNFDGSDDIINLGALDVSGSGLTIAAWVKADSYPGTYNDSRILTKATGSAEAAHVFMLSTIKRGMNTVLRGRIQVEGTTVSLIGTGNGLTLGQWHHTALTYDGETLRLYLDGVVTASTALTGQVDQDSSVDVTVGGQLNLVKFWDGNIDDVILAQHGFTSTEIQRIAQGAPGVPVANADTYSTGYETELTVPTLTGLLSNDTRTTSGVLTSSVENGPLNGTLLLNTEGSFQYTPNAGYRGVDTFSYFANDGSQDSVSAAVVSINVFSAPTAVDDSYVLLEDEVLTVLTDGVLSNDIDLEPPLDLFARVLTHPVNGSLAVFADNGAFTYVPNENFNGTDSFIYEAVDGQYEVANRGTVSLIIEPVSDQPIGVLDSLEYELDTVLKIDILEHLLANDYDIDGKELYLKSFTQPVYGVLAGDKNGHLYYTPNNGYRKNDSFEYTISNGDRSSDPIVVNIYGPPVTGGGQSIVNYDGVIQAAAAAVGTVFTYEDIVANAMPEFVFSSAGEYLAEFLRQNPEVHWWQQNHFDQVITVIDEPSSDGNVVIIKPSGGDDTQIIRNAALDAGFGGVVKGSGGPFRVNQMILDQPGITYLDLPMIPSVVETDYLIRVLASDSVFIRSPVNLLDRNVPIAWIVDSGAHRFTMVDGGISNAVNVLKRPGAFLHLNKDLEDIYIVGNVFENYLASNQANTARGIWWASADIHNSPRRGIIAGNLFQNLQSTGSGNDADAIAIQGFDFNNRFEENLQLLANVAINSGKRFLKAQSGGIDAHANFSWWRDLKGPLGIRVTRAHFDSQGPSYCRWTNNIARTDKSNPNAESYFMTMQTHRWSVEFESSDLVYENNIYEHNDSVDEQRKSYAFSIYDQEGDDVVSWPIDSTISNNTVRGSGELWHAYWFRNGKFNEPLLDPLGNFFDHQDNSIEVNVSASLYRTL